ncbi:MAG: hypothetical protein ACRDYC_04720 [Acidimicrobiales bacterium]
MKPVRVKAARLVPALVLATLLTGCGVETLSFPTPPAGEGIAGGTTVPSDFVNMPLPGVAAKAAAGATTSTAAGGTVAMGPGNASLNGTVVGPSGPVPGATVEIVREVGSAIGTADVTTAADGTWQLTKILGGDFRVRAWLAPTLAVTTPQVVFLADAGSQSVNLTMTSFSGSQVAATISPSPPLVGQVDELTLAVTNTSVGSNGVVADAPLVGARVTVSGYEWQVQGAATETTGPTGTAGFVVTCDLAGPEDLTATLAGQAPVPLALPACSPFGSVSSVPSTATTANTTPYQPGATTTTTSVLGGLFG